LLGKSSYNLRAKGISLLWAEYTEALPIVYVTVSHVRNTDIYFLGSISLRRPCSGSEVQNTRWRTNWLRCRTRFRKRSTTRGLWETWCPHAAPWRLSPSSWVSWRSNNWVESIPSSSIREKYLRVQAVPYPPPLLL